MINPLDYVNVFALYVIIMWCTPVVIAFVLAWWTWIQGLPPEPNWKHVFWYRPVHFVLPLIGVQCRKVDYRRSHANSYEYKLFFSKLWPSEKSDPKEIYDDEDQELKTGFYLLALPMAYAMSAAVLYLHIDQVVTWVIGGFILLSVALKKCFEGFRSAIAKHATDPNAHEPSDEE